MRQAGPRSRPGALANLGLFVAALVAGLLILELACRAYRGPQALLDWHNLPIEAHHFVPSPGRSAHDLLVGTVPRPGFHSPDVNIGDDGMREAPPPAAPLSGRPLLAIGDSYAYGLDVADRDSWPAILQALTNRRTIDAGVPGFGLDQAVLRAEQLAARFEPAVIVLSFIADDLWRNEFHRLWGSEKPWFSLGPDDALALHNVPVPEPRPGDGERTLTFWQRAFGWSLLVETILRRTTEHDRWISDHERATPPGTGERLACPLMKRAAAIGVATLVVAQYDHTLWQAGRDARRSEFRRQTALVLDCARAAGMATLDTFDLVERAVREHGATAIYTGEHHTALGNRLVAEAIAAELRRRGLVGRKD